MHALQSVEYGKATVFFSKEHQCYFPEVVYVLDCLEFALPQRFYGV